MRHGENHVRLQALHIGIIFYLCIQVLLIFIHASLKAVGIVFIALYPSSVNFLLLLLRNQVLYWLISSATVFYLKYIPSTVVIQVVEIFVHLCF